MMFATWAPLQSVLNAGIRHIIDDQAVWTAPMAEFQLACRITKPLVAEFDLLTQEDGLLVRGRLYGQVSLPCARCTEDAFYDIDHRFDSFEPFPNVGDDAENDVEIDQYFMRPSAHGSGVEINLGALAWQEFTQALPDYPVCSEECAGLCPVCGKNLNTGPCGCASNSDDPRMAKLRGLKLH